MSFYKINHGFNDIFTILELNDVPEMSRVPCKTHARYDALRMKGWMTMSVFGGAQREAPAKVVISYKPKVSLRAIYFLSEAARYLVTPDNVNGPFQPSESIGKIAIFGTPKYTRIGFVGSESETTIDVGMSKYQALQASKGLFLAASKKLTEVHAGDIKPVESVQALLQFA